MGGFCLFNTWIFSPGMFDQLMALQWVKDNIEQFGENVKIFLMSANSIIIIIIIISIYLLILMSTSFEHFSTLFKNC